MQIERATTTLLSALGDPQGLIYSSQDTGDALRRSLIAYSDYFPSLRQMGQATLVSAVAAGALGFEIIGGLPIVGTVYTIGYGSFVSESCTVASVEYTPYNTTILTIAAPLANQYYPGMLVSPPYPAGQTQPVLGLQLVAGQNTYQLPLDFLKVEPESFSVAIGDRLSYKTQDAYFDESQNIFNRLNSTGYGRSQSWSTYSGSGYPIFGNPLAQPSVSGGNGPTELVFEFIEGNFPYMAMSNPPSSTVLLTFNYYGIQTMASIPNSQEEVISLYAQYVCLEASANRYLYGGDVEIEDYKETNSDIADSLHKQALQALKKFEDRCKYLVYIVAG